MGFSMGKSMTYVLVWFLVSSFFLPIFGNIDFRTGIEDIHFRGSYEKGGYVTVSINGDDFADSSKENPHFIRLRFDHNATLSYDMVGWPGQDDRRRKDPIYLAVRLIMNQNDTQLNVPSHTVSIVRWLENENQIWLRVNSSSSTWIINSDGESVPPSSENGRVEWTLGIPGQQSVKENHTEFLNGRTNLPANTRDLNWQALPGQKNQSTDTQIIVNVSESNLQPWPNPESILYFDDIRFIESNFDSGLTGIFTAPTSEDIERGQQYGVSFGLSGPVARGRDLLTLDCSYGAITLKNHDSSWTGVVLTNPHLHTNYAMMKGFSKMGDLVFEETLDLAPLTQRKMLLDNALNISWFQVDSLHPLTGNGFYEDTREHVLLTLPLSVIDDIETDYVISHVPASKWGWKSQLYIANPSEQELIVSATYHQMDQSKSTEVIFSLQGNTAESFYLCDYFPTATQGGQIHLKSNHTIIAMILLEHMTASKVTNQTIVPVLPYEVQ